MVEVLCEQCLHDRSAKDPYAYDVYRWASCRIDRFERRRSLSCKANEFSVERPGLKGKTCVNVGAA